MGDQEKKVRNVFIKYIISNPNNTLDIKYVILFAFDLYKQCYNVNKKVFSKNTQKIIWILDHKGESYDPEIFKSFIEKKITIADILSNTDQYISPLVSDKLSIQVLRRKNAQRDGFAYVDGKRCKYCSGPLIHTMQQTCIGGDEPLGEKYICIQCDPFRR